MSGVSMALDSELRHSVGVEDWSDAMAQSSYHLPFVGAGRHAWDAWHTGNHGSAVWHASMFGIEALGVRCAVGWAGKVGWDFEGRKD
jgi:hypothetical protein